MMGRLLALATRWPRATLGVLVALAVAGGLVGVLVPVDGRLDRLAPSGSAAEKAGQTERASFGGDTAVVIVRGDMVKVLRSGDLVKLVGLEGCLAGVPNPKAKGPCAKLRDLKGVVSVQGPGTYANSALAQIGDSADEKIASAKALVEAARTQTEAAAKKKGFSKAQITEAGNAAAQVAQLQALGQLSAYAQQTGLGDSAFSASLTDQNFLKSLLFAKGTDGKLGPKRRLAWLMPNRDTALIQVRLDGNLSVGRRAEVTKQLQAALHEPAFRMANASEVRFTGLAPATQQLSEAIRRSALALGAAALLVMAGVLLLARRLRRRLLPVLVAAAVLGTAIMALALPTGSLSLAVVVALPVLVGLAVDQAVQAQLRLERRMHPAVLRTLVIAGAAASASALALLASPFGVVRTVAVAIAGAILFAIIVAAAASAAAISLGNKRAAKAAPSPADGVRAAARDADELLGGSAPLRAGRSFGRGVSAMASRIGRGPAIGILLLGLLLAVGGAALGSKARVQTDLTALVPPTSAGAKQLQQLRKETGSPVTVSLVVRTKNVGDPALWRYLLATQQSVAAGGTGRCDGEGLCNPLPLNELFASTPGKQPTDKQIATTLSILPENVSRALIDPDKGVVALPFGIGTLDGAKQRQLVQQLQVLTKAAPGGTTVAVSGLPAVVDASATALEAPGRRALLALLAVLLPGIVLLITLRSVRRTLVALVPPAFALGWSELALWALGVPRTPLTAALGVLVAAVAVEFSVLLGERFAALRRAGIPRARAIDATLRETGGAVAISAGATIAGFAILGVASIPVISEFGIATAVDLAIVLVALVAVGPATWVLADRDPSPAAAKARKRRAPADGPGTTRAPGGAR